MCTVKGEKCGVKISVFMDLRQDIEDLPFLGWKETTRGSRLESDNGGMNEDCRDGRQVVTTTTTINYSLPPNETLGDKDNTRTTTTPMQQSTIEHAFCDDGLCRLIFVVVSGVFCIGGVYRGFVDLYRLYRPPCIVCIGVVSFVSVCIVCIGICIVCIGCCFEQLYRLYRVVSTLAKCADSCIFLSMYSNLQKYQYR